MTDRLEQIKAQAEKGYPIFPHDALWLIRELEQSRAAVKRWEDKEASRGHKCSLIEKERDELRAEVERLKRGIEGVYCAATREAKQALLERLLCK
jgi:hypothetical protein